MAESFAYGERGNSLGIAESRIHARTEVRALAYVELSDENAGLILNISEDGLAVQAVQVVTSEYFPRVRFRLPKTDRTIEVAGKMVWQLRSRKEVGIQFVDLPDGARSYIQEWMAAEPLRLAAPPEPSRRRVLQPEKPFPPSAAEAEPAVSAPATEPVAPSEPIVFAPASSIPPRPVEPCLPTDEPTLNVSPVETSPQPEELVRPPVEVPDPVPQPDLGSFPLGRVSVPDLKRADEPRLHVVLPDVVPHTAPNVLAWKAPVAPALTSELKKPGRWWIYTAALLIIAALGFAGLMIIDPGAISRTRVTTVSHEPDATATPDSPQPAAGSFERWFSCNVAAADAAETAGARKQWTRLSQSERRRSADLLSAASASPGDRKSSRACQLVRKSRWSIWSRRRREGDAGPIGRSSDQFVADSLAKSDSNTAASSSDAHHQRGCTATGLRADVVTANGTIRKRASGSAKGSGRCCVGESEQACRSILCCFAEHGRFTCGAERAIVGDSERFGGCDLAIPRDSDSAGAEDEGCATRRQSAARANALELFTFLSP